MDHVSPFEPVPSRVDLPELDRRISAWWQRHDVFARSLRQTAGGPSWVFYEGPPTANGSPGTHHVEARVFKDIFPRYKTMKGFSVPRQAGWDCHGLPVELSVEKELGINGKPEIEKFGIAAFNALCRQSVMRHVGEFEALTARMGYWIDLEHPYETMSPEYIDSVWWSLKKIYADGRLTEDFRVAPYCTRCGTTLSDHEVAQGYQDVTDVTVYAGLRLVGDLAGESDVDLLVWTTTPWTLVSNTAVAVNPEITYQLVRSDDDTFVVAKDLVGEVFGSDVAVLSEFAGRDLVGRRYLPALDLVAITDAHVVVAADYVSVAEGTGLVHLAPAFGAEDLKVCQANQLPVVNPIGPDGRFDEAVPLVGGMFFKDADAVVISELGRAGRLMRQQAHTHSYPHCWRCHTPLMYYAQPSWYIRTTAVRDALQRENENTTWYPDHIKHGRYGDWLENNVDWALSRTRYWGTPLPLWRCPQGHVTAVGSRAELGSLAGCDLSDLDPHRPFIDAVTFPCPTCEATASRVSEVIDAWYDSGSMPFAAIGYPHREGSRERFEANYPAQYICEAIDQTRGWFYTLMAVGTLVFDRSSYENVVCLGHILAEDGRKMSKHLGNTLAPIPLMDTFGADALRWFMACSGSPWAPRRIGAGPLEEIQRKLLLTYWNVASFFSVYAAGSPWEPDRVAPPHARPILDRWILGELQALVRQVDTRLETYDTAGAGRVLLEFLDDLSNWYVRRSRPRFWAGDAAALATLFECLRVLTLLLAPFVPFITEQVWQSVVRPGQGAAAESVHLASWPAADVTLIDDRLREEVRLARTLAELGRAGRKASELRVRQPLGRAVFGLPAGRTLSDALLVEVAAELNVKALLPLSSSDQTIVDVTVKPNFRALGRRFGKRTQQVADMVPAADSGALVDQLRSTGRVIVQVDGEPVSLTLEELVVTELPRTGWVVQAQSGVTIALDTQLTPELIQEGLARDVVRIVQTARRAAELAVSDRILLRIGGPAPVTAAVERHREFVAGETLATELEILASLPDGYPGVVGDGSTVWVTVSRVPG